MHKLRSAVIVLSQQLHALDAGYTNWVETSLAGNPGTTISLSK